MFQYIRYLRSLNLTALTNQILGNLIATDDADSDHAFRQLYKWKSLKDGFEEAKKIEKPIFLLIHKTWCPACQKLKTKITQSIRLIDLSSQFVMINVKVDKESMGNERKFRPDGKYVPRVLFYTSDGDLIEEAYNRHPKADGQYKYFYSGPTQIIDTMLFVLKNYSVLQIPETFQGKVTRDPDNKKLLNNQESDDDFIGPTLLE